CYWCHVMEREVFENEALARQMNEGFVCVKVDREERPDVDDLYMTATQLMTQRGGWPMSAFLTPPQAAGEDDQGLKPFWCGTYIPPEPQHGMPGFGDVLDGISNAWQNQRSDVIEQAQRVTDAIEQVFSRDGEEGAAAEDEETQPAQLGPETVQSVANAMLQMYDQEHGGFGSAPKFPQPANVLFLLAVYQATKNEPLWPVLHHTLDRMARGGMYDQVGGGFHRYSTDAKWLVPHFEKMLYDNGQLVELYTEAYRAKPDERASALYRRVVTETCEYVIREMTDDTGAFWSAQDAEVDGHEGGNYLWTEPQVREAIGDDDLADLAVHMYGLDLGTNFQDPHVPDAERANVLFLPQPLSELSEQSGIDMTDLAQKREEINRRLLAVRDKRKQPGTDDKVITGWNGMMIAGLAKAGAAFDREDFIDAAARAADAVLQHMAHEDGGLYRTMRKGQPGQRAYLEDYAHFLHGLIELHRARPAEERFLEQASRLVALTSQRFGGEHGGYFDTLADQSDLLVRKRSTHDGAVPSGNSQMVHDLIDMQERTHDDRWLQLAALDLRSFARPMNSQGGAMVHMVHALLRMLMTAPSMVRSGQAAEQAEAGQTHRQSPATVDPVTVEADPGEVHVDGQAEITVTLRIDEGFHVNAAEPSSDWLVPTELSLRGAEGVELEVDYPEPASAAFAFADQPIDVYEGEVKLTARLRKSADAQRVEPGELVVTYQPCDASRCLPPTTQAVPVTVLA
ncbi:MAG: DUF255 domain-containing protein, partial [Phycisphaeraceae bacterium]